MNEFLGLMLDPFVDGRGGSSTSGGALGFAPDQQTSLPPDIVSAYARMTQGAAATDIRPALERVGRGLRRQQPRRNGDPSVGSKQRNDKHLRLRRRHGLSLLARHRARLLARRRRHQLESGAGRSAPAGAMRFWPASMASTHAGPVYRRRRARLCQQLVHNRPHGVCRRSAHRALRGPGLRRRGSKAAIALSFRRSRHLSASRPTRPSRRSTSTRRLTARPI